MEQEHEQAGYLCPGNMLYFCYSAESLIGAVSRAAQTVRNETHKLLPKETIDTLEAFVCAPQIFLCDECTLIDSENF